MIVFILLIWLWTVCVCVCVGEWMTVEHPDQSWGMEWAFCWWKWRQQSPPLGLWAEETSESEGGCDRSSPKRERDTERGAHEDCDNHTHTHVANWPDLCLTRVTFGVPRTTPVVGTESHFTVDGVTITAPVCPGKGAETQSHDPTV